MPALNIRSINIEDDNVLPADAITVSGQILVQITDPNQTEVFFEYILMLNQYNEYEVNNNLFTLDQGTEYMVTVTNLSKNQSKVGYTLARLDTNAFLITADETFTFGPAVSAESTFFVPAGYTNSFNLDVHIFLNPAPLVGDPYAGFHDLELYNTSPFYQSDLTSVPLWPNEFYRIPDSNNCSHIVDDVFLCANDDSSGIGQYINYINTNDVLAMPQVPPINALSTNASFVTAIGSFTYLPTKKFSRFQTLADSRMFDLTPEGPIGQLSPKSQLVFRLPNTKAALGVLKKIANAPGIIVFSNGSNHKIILGTKLFPAKISAFATKQSETESYIEITITSGTKYPMYYSGNL